MTAKGRPDSPRAQQVPGSHASNATNIMLHPVMLRPEDSQRQETMRLRPRFLVVHASPAPVHTCKCMHAWSRLLSRAHGTRSPEPCLGCFPKERSQTASLAPQNLLLKGIPPRFILAST